MFVREGNPQIACAPTIGRVDLSGDDGSGEGVLDSLPPNETALRRGGGGAPSVIS